MGNTIGSYKDILAAYRLRKNFIFRKREYKKFSSIIDYIFEEVIIDTAFNSPHERYRSAIDVIKFPRYKIQRAKILMMKLLIKTKKG